MANSYEIRALSEDDPERPLNVALVKDGEAAGALRAMFAAVSGGGDVNAAVWTDEVSDISDSQRQELARRAEAEGFSVSRTAMPESGDFSALTRLFNRMARNKDAWKPLEEHIRRRLRAMAEAFPDKKVMLSINADKAYTRAASVAGGSPHVDNGSDTKIKFIETVSGGATCFIDNRQAVFGGTAERTRPVVGKITFWQAATGALALMTLGSNKPRPVMHSAPPLEEISDGETRIVVMYDLVDKPKGLLDRVVALFS